MKFERNKSRTVSARDADCYKRFLAGNKTAYAQAFWENGPRVASKDIVDTDLESSLSKAPNDAQQR